MEPRDEYIWNADVAFVGSAIHAADGTWHGRGVFSIGQRSVLRLDIQDGSVREFDDSGTQEQAVTLRGTARLDRAGYSVTNPFWLFLYQRPDGLQVFQFALAQGPPETGFMYSNYYFGSGMDAFNGGFLRIT